LTVRPESCSLASEWSMRIASRTITWWLLGAAQGIHSGWPHAWPATRSQPVADFQLTRELTPDLAPRWLCWSWMVWGKSPKSRGPAEPGASSAVARPNDSLGNLRPSLPAHLETPLTGVACRASYAQVCEFEPHPAHLREQLKTRISTGFLIVKT
jgi:hypothetical protein